MSGVLAAATGPSAYWYLARGTGAVSLVLLTASVVLGVLGPLRFAAAPRWPRFAVDFLHRDISLLVVVVLVIHILTSVLDGFAPINLLDAVIPFAGTYRPLWLGFGALAFDLIIALVITSMMRRRLGYRAWRAVHWLAYASWPVAVLHGLGTGTDTKLWWMLLLTALCTLAVLIATWVRVVDAEDRSVRTWGLGLSLVTVLGLAVFTLAGPLQKGWSRRAGTPSNLLGPSVAAASPTGPSADPSVEQKLGRAFSGRVHGTVSQQNATEGSIVELDLRVSGPVNGRLRVRLGGTPSDEGGLSMTGSQVDFAAQGMPSVLQGQVVSLQGDQFLARISDGSGLAVDLQANLNIGQQSDQVTGTVSGTPAGGVG